MRIKAITAGLLLPILFIAGILLSSTVGYWRTRGSGNPTKFTTGIFEGEVEHTENSEKTTIKGKTLFSDLLDWGLSKEQIEATLGIPMGAKGMTVRDFCSEKGIGFSTVKEPLQELLDKM